MNRSATVIVRIHFLIITGIAPFHAFGAPVLYSQPFYQSPVTASPGELLMLPGIGLAADNIVVYQLIEDTTNRLTPPSKVPNEVKVSSGIAPVVSGSDTPYSLTVRWPEVTKQDQSYAVWVHTSEGEWSNGIRVNDARPLWITPSFGYVSERVGTLPRYLKVVGRNLHPANGVKTKIKLINIKMRNEQVTLLAENVGGADTLLNHYVAEVKLPSTLKQGTYRVLVTRDSKSWVSIDDQVFTVYPDPKAPREIKVSSFGCNSNDGQDDTGCIRKAVAKAASVFNQDTVVVLSEGTWNFNEQSGGRDIGIELVEGVSIRGEGAHRTILLRDISSVVINRRPGPWFFLHGKNTVRDITFKDLVRYDSRQTPSAVLQLGRPMQLEDERKAYTVSDIVVHGNIFDRPFRAIVDGGWPIQRLYINNNEFGAFDTAILLDGFPIKSVEKFSLDDSVISNNIFKPGSFMDVLNRQGTIASQIGAAMRVDFSRNVADGTSLEYLYDRESDARGWRAAFFWHMRNNHEMLLVAQNRASCTGDKTGDGEFLAFDNNHNSFGFARPQNVLSATQSTVTVLGPLQAHHEKRKLSDHYFNKHWIQVAEGMGVGQVRRIVSYDESEQGVALTVMPPWDVVPDVTSRVTVGLEFWQLMVLDNFVDHSDSICLKSNRRRSSNAAYGAGVIGLWAQAADSVVAGNTQLSANGITIHPFYSAPGIGCHDCDSSILLQYFIDVRKNRISREYNWDSDCSWSGITVSYGAAPIENFPPPTLAYGLIIAGNTVTQADGMSGGAISIVPSWWEGAKSSTPTLIRNTLIYGNTIRDMIGGVRDRSCNRRFSRRTGITLASPAVKNTILDSNVCINTNKNPIQNQASGTLTITSQPSSEHCENGYVKKIW